MPVYIPKMWEMYFTVDDDATVRSKMCREDKVDIFNIMSGNCYHTEAEAQAEEFIQLRRLSKARESLNDDFITRFSKHLDRVI